MRIQHTPTLPIRYIKEGQYIADKSGYKMLYMNPICDHEEEALSIVKAVNNHDRLVEALTNMVAYMEEFCDVPDSDMTFNESKQLLTELKQQ